MFFIAEGRLDVVSGVSDASEFVLHQGNCFGELALLFRERRNMGAPVGAGGLLERDAEALDTAQNDVRAAVLQCLRVAD